MNIAKNMELIFIAALALVSATTLASAAVPAHRAAPAIVATAVTQANAPMAVVTITAKRLSAAQKAALGN